MSSASADPAPPAGWRRYVPAWARGAGQRELALLLTLALLAGGLWAFATLADEVSEGETRSFDERVLLALRTPGDLDDPVGAAWVEEMGRDFTALGGVAVLTVLTLAVIGLLLLEHKRRAALLVAVAVGGGIVLSLLLKGLFERPRPELVAYDSAVYTSSFPSGHSMMAAVVYLTLAALVAQVQEHRRVKVYLLAVAILLTLAVGVSRIYVGVHWPTDVLAGWTAGAVWALACWQLARVLQRRGQIEGEGVEPEVAAEEARQRAEEARPAPPTSTPRPT
jgi:undecaprenyl-diphosphatase